MTVTRWDPRRIPSAALGLRPRPAMLPISPPPRVWTLPALFVCAFSMTLHMARSSRSRILLVLTTRRRYSTGFFFPFITHAMLAMILGFFPWQSESAPLGLRPHLAMLLVSPPPHVLILPPFLSMHPA